MEGGNYEVKEVNLMGSVILKEEIMEGGAKWRNIQAVRRALRFQLLYCSKRAIVKKKRNFLC